MTPERQMIAWAVLQGELSEDHLTLDEVEEIQLRVQEAVMDRKMVDLHTAGTHSVFWGCDNGDTLQ